MDEESHYYSMKRDRNVQGGTTRFREEAEEAFFMKGGFRLTRRNENNRRKDLGIKIWKIQQSCNISKNLHFMNKLVYLHKHYIRTVFSLSLRGIQR